MLGDFNAAGVIDSADVHVAQRITALGEETDERVALAVAVAVRALRGGSVCVDLTTAAGDIAPGLPWPEPAEWLAAVRADLYQFDLVVTDYNMTHLSGLELAQAVKAMRPGLPIILASGYITEELRAKAPAAGIRELIYKPNTVDDLCEAVARYANAQTAGGAPKSS